MFTDNGHIYLHWNSEGKLNKVRLRGGKLLGIHKGVGSGEFGFSFNLRIHESNNTSLSSAEEMGRPAGFPQQGIINGSN